MNVLCVQQFENKSFKLNLNSLIQMVALLEGLFVIRDSKIIRKKLEILPDVYVGNVIEEVPDRTGLQVCNSHRDRPRCFECLYGEIHQEGTAKNNNKKYI